MVETGGAARRLLDLDIPGITNVEIDGNVVEVAKKYFPDISLNDLLFGNKALMKLITLKSVGNWQ